MFKQFSFPTWIPKPTNIEQNRIPKSLPVLILFLKRFLITFCSQLLPPDRHFSSPRCSHSTISPKSHFEVDLAFCPYFGADLAPLSLPQTSKILPKFLPKTTSKSFTIVVPILMPCWLHFGTPNGTLLAACSIKNQPKIPQHPPRPA